MKRLPEAVVLMVVFSSTFYPSTSQTIRANFNINIAKTSEIRDDRVIKAKIVVSRIANVVSTVDLNIEIVGEKYSFIRKESEKCIELNDRKMKRKIEFSNNEKEKVEEILFRVYDEEFTLKIEGKAGDERIEFDRKFKTYIETEPQEKEYDLRFKRFSSYYVSGPENLEVYKSEIKCKGKLSQEFKYTEKLFQKTDDFKAAIFPFALNYLKHIKNVSQEQENKIKRDCEAFYKETASKYSAEKNDFKLNGFNGALSSSAFFLKFLKLAKDLIKIDATLITKLEATINSKQNVTGDQGFFSEQKNESNLEKVRLTALAISALSENSTTATDYKDRIEKAEKFIVDNLSEVKDAYTMAITGYALTFNRPEISKKIMTKYFGEKFSISIETAPYVILTASRIDRKYDASEILNLLVDLQSSVNGGFGSVMDTTMAYQAATEMIKHPYSKENQISVKISTSREEKSIKIDNSNAYKSQRLLLSNGNGKGNGGVSLNMEGTGMAFCQVINRVKNRNGGNEFENFTRTCARPKPKEEPGFLARYFFWLGF